MGQLEDMQILVRIVEAGSISAAAEQLSTTKSKISRRLTQLEKHLGVTLLRRTTRQMTLTEAGQHYYQRCQGILEEVSELNQYAQESTHRISGPLHIAAPLTFGTLHLSAAIDAFLKRYPDVQLKLSLADSQHRLVEQGIDVALRIARLEDSTLRARRLTEIRFMLCAAPDYLKARGQPQTLAALQQHKILHYSLGPTQWQLQQAGQPAQQLDYRPYLTADNGEILCKLAIAGQGIALLPTFICWQAIATGQLLPVLPDYQIAPINAWLVYPNTRFQPLRLRLLLDFLCQRFGGNPYWDQAIASLPPK